MRTPPRGAALTHESHEHVAGHPHARACRAGLRRRAAPVAVDVALRTGTQRMRVHILGTLAPGRGGVSLLEAFDRLGMR